MRKLHTRVFAAAIALSLLAINVSHHARAQRNADRSGIDTYAITGARIVIVSGPAIERGTIVIRDGLINAVGANVNAPADARIIDGTGLTVYPGLIDAYTNLGIPQPSPGAGGGGGGGGGIAAFLLAQAQPQQPPAGLATQPVGLQPETLAVDLIRPGGDQIDAARNAGITAALSVPRTGIFIGQSAFINLSGDTAQQMLLRTPVAMHIGFTPRQGGYPGSLMGVFAALRQMFLDAQRYREANAIYEKNPRGIRRPEQDLSLAALQPALARQMPVVLQANSQREIERALDLAQEFNLRAIIAGGAEAYKVADRLAAAKVPVLLTLNFPRRTTAQTPDAAPDPVRVLRERVEAPKNAGRLAAAGVRFAFQDGGLANISDFLTNAGKAIDNGLARDEALRAMTIRAAEILGLDAQLGTIETGKIANLTVTRGDIFDRNHRVTNVFIDGRPVDLRPAAAQGGIGSGMGGAPTATGTWTLRIKLGTQPEKSATLNLRQEGAGRLSGTMQGDLGEAQIADASIGTGGDIKFTATVTIPTGTRQASFSGTMTGNQMSGTVQIVDSGDTGAFTGTRAGGAGPPASGTTPQATQTPATMGVGGAANLSGTWTLNATLGQNPITMTVNLQQQGESLTGNMRGPFGQSDISNGSVTPEGFRFTTSVTFGGRTLEVTYTGTVSGNQMSGTATSQAGSIPFAGTRAPQEEQ